MQRVTQPRSVGIQFSSDEPICKIVNGESIELWESTWLSNSDLKAALNASKMVVGSVIDAPEVIKDDEVELFRQNAWEY